MQKRRFSTAMVLATLWLGTITIAAHQARAAEQPSTRPADPTTVPARRMTVLAQSAALQPKFKPKAARPVQAVAMETCTTADCHANIKQYDVVHGPVNVNSCDACHKLVSEKEHKYELLRARSEVCTFCHQVDTKGAAVVHKPLENGECLACHNPHGGKTAKVLRAETMHGLCKQCHEDPIGGKKMLHGPVAAGACEGCHAAHATDHPKLLIAEGQELCFTCHSEMKTQMAQAKFIHKPAQKDCLHCHEAHASDYPMQIRQQGVELCTSCHEHEKIRNDVLAAKYKHSIVTKDQACLNCHTAHGGDLAKLVREEPVKVCMKCHDKPVDAGNGRMIPAVVDVLDPDLSKHGPIRDGNCSGCHSVHGSDVSRLLSKPYGEQFYQPFSIEKYDLCFSCHDKQLVLLPKTDGLTGFRNGTQNLHYLHVNKSNRGRSCRACHSTHSSKQPVHLRETVPYGKWNMPLTFKRTDTGGSCAPGCHKPYDYDRQKPVAYDPPKPASGGASPKAAASTPARAATVGTAASPAGAPNAGTPRP